VVVLQLGGIAEAKSPDHKNRMSQNVTKGFCKHGNDLSDYIKGRESVETVCLLGCCTMQSDECLLTIQEFAASIFRQITDDSCNRQRLFL
jgi:hypothetical protein